MELFVDIDPNFPFGRILQVPPHLAQLTVDTSGKSVARGSHEAEHPVPLFAGRWLLVPGIEM